MEYLMEELKQSTFCMLTFFFLHVKNIAKTYAK